jgi:hypothetical protein
MFLQNVGGLPRVYTACEDESLLAMACFMRPFSLISIYDIFESIDAKKGRAVA